ncbi:DNA cytosine methyltransferase [Ascidiaceihabitans sp.]|uniref:DNA cytosine methyltransferase n=1 Tax=Ascidiaceihabitans sp. TaxID=1872644 RepID=UPI003296CCDD
MDKKFGSNQWVDSGQFVMEPIAHALRGEGYDASEDGTGRGTPLVPVAGTLCSHSFSGGASGRPEGAAAGHFVPVAFSSKDYGADALDDLCPTIRAGGHDGSHDGSHANAGVPPAIAFQDRFRGDDGRGYDRPPPTTTELTGAIDTVKPWHVAQPWAVRRLSPTECARLQGFPDDHTAIKYRGKDAADGPQYKALGNSMAVPCIKWIMDRMKASMENTKGRAA